MIGKALVRVIGEDGSVRMEERRVMTKEQEAERIRLNIENTGEAIRRRALAAYAEGNGK